MKYCSRPFTQIWVTMTFDQEEKSISLPCAWLNIGQADDTDLSQYTLDEVWHSETFHKVRDSIIDGSFRFCDHRTCPFISNDTLSDVGQEDFDNLTKVEEFPTEFNLAYDRTCNHACPSCREEIYHPNEEQRKRVEIISEKVLPYLSKADYINSNGQGDFFASKSNLDLFQKVTPKSAATEISIETNGVLFHEKNWEKIKHLSDAHLTVVITPSSFDRDTYAYLNGGFDSLEKLEQNLRFIRTLREEEKIKEFKLVIVVQDTNVKEAPAFIKKCLDEYKVDSVIVRPIYKWNFLSEEDYWFKNVSNPLHPYHIYYQKLLDSPIMQDKRVYNWDGSNASTPQKHPAYVYKEIADDMGKLLLTDGIGEKLEAFFKENKIEDIILYGDGLLGKAFIKQLRQTKIKVRFILAKNPTSQKIGGVGAKALDTYRCKDQDVIVVSNYHHIEPIKRDLNFLGFHGRIISIDEILRMVVEQGR